MPQVLPDADLPPAAALPPSPVKPTGLPPQPAKPAPPAPQRAARPVLMPDTPAAPTPSSPTPTNQPASVPQPSSAQPKPARRAGVDLPPDAMPSSRPTLNPAAPIPSSPGPARVMSFRPVLVGDVQSAMVREQHEEELSAEEQIKESLRKNATPMLVSLVAHMILIIVAGLWAISTHEYNSIMIVATATEEGEQLISDSVTISNALPTPDASFTNTALPQVSNPFAAMPKVDVAMATSGVPEVFIKAPTMGIALQGRDEGMRSMLGKKYGATLNSDNAVLQGLQWLASKQDKKTGRWQLRGHDRLDNEDLVVNENYVAATAMALIAFQGFGHTHATGRFAPNVNLGINYLLSQQDREGCFCPSIPPSEKNYAHAQATMAICELYGMTGDNRFKDGAQRALNYLVAVQDVDLGGWRYQAKFDADTSVTGWAFMALQSGKMANLEVPNETFERVAKYLDLATAPGAFNLTMANKKVSFDKGVVYSYLPDQNPNIVMTSVAMLLRQYLGTPRDDTRLVQAAKLLIEADFLPRWEERDVYYWYYATQFLHHMEGEYWEKWNNMQRDMLVTRQDTDGVNKGSWNPLGAGSTRSNGADVWAMNRAGGRLYVTCHSIFILEVYYRHLPIYSDFKKRLEAAAKAASNK